MDPPIFFIEAALTPHETEELTVYAEPRLYSSTTTGSPGKQTKVRTSKQIFYARDRLSLPVSVRLRRRFARFLGVPVGHLEALQVLRYEDYELYRPHHDGSLRQATALMWLSDVPFGGGTEFASSIPHVEETAAPDDGTAASGNRAVGGGTTFDAARGDGPPRTAARALADAVVRARGAARGTSASSGATLPRAGAVPTRMPTESEYAVSLAAARQTYIDAVDALRKLRATAAALTAADGEAASLGSSATGADGGAVVHPGAALDVIHTVALHSRAALRGMHRATAAIVPPLVVAAGDHVGARWNGAVAAAERLGLEASEHANGTAAGDANATIASGGLGDVPVVAGGGRVWRGGGRGWRLAGFPAAVVAVATAMDPNTYVDGGAARARTGAPTPPSTQAPYATTRGALGVSLRDLRAYALGVMRRGAFAPAARCAGHNNVSAVVGRGWDTAGLVLGSAGGPAMESHVGTAASEVGVWDTGTAAPADVSGSSPPSDAWRCRPADPVVWFDPRDVGTYTTAATLNATTAASRWWSDAVHGPVVWGGVGLPHPPTTGALGGGGGGGGGGGVADRAVAAAAAAAASSVDVKYINATYSRSDAAAVMEAFTTTSDAVTVHVLRHRNHSTSGASVATGDPVANGTIVVPAAVLTNAPPTAWCALSDSNTAVATAVDMARAVAAALADRTTLTMWRDILELAIRVGGAQPIVHRQDPTPAPLPPMANSTLFALATSAGAHCAARWMCDGAARARGGGTYVGGRGKLRLPPFANRDTRAVNTTYIQRGVGDGGDVGSWYDARSEPAARLVTPEVDPPGPDAGPVAAARVACAAAFPCEPRHRAAVSALARANVWTVRAAAKAAVAATGVEVSAESTSLSRTVTGWVADGLVVVRKRSDSARRGDAAAVMAAADTGSAAAAAAALDAAVAPRALIAMPRRLCGVVFYSLAPDGSRISGAVHEALVPFLNSTKWVANFFVEREPVTDYAW